MPPDANDTAANLGALGLILLACAAACNSPAVGVAGVVFIAAGFAATR